MSDSNRSTDVLSSVGHVSASVWQQAVGLNADLDKVSRWRTGMFVGVKRSLGSAIIGLLLCVLGVKSSHLDRPSVRLVIPGLYMSVIGYSSCFAIYPEMRELILWGCL
jgi:hypothetical protein